MVSDRKSLKNHKSTSHGVTKQGPISGLRYVINTLRTNCHDSILLESFIRGVVRDVVESKFQERLLSSEKANEAGKSGARPLELCFININNKLSGPFFSQSNIIAKDEPPLQVALFDVGSKSIVNVGPFSSTKIEICALDGGFGSEDWTEIEFKANILRERDGKQPLLVGERFITLKNGVASISKTIFTDNSRWLRSKMFRLGVKAMQNGDIIKEARSQPFRVKDNRGQPNEKHFPPFLNDYVWRLEKIAKDGRFHKRLSSNGIHTVKDLLQLLIINESSLHGIFEKIQRKSWLAIIEHAKSCVLDDHKLYSYGTIGQPILLFNAIYKLVGVTFDVQKFYLPETLTPNLKHSVEIVKQDAYKDVCNLKPVDETFLNSISLDACIQSAGQFGAPVQGQTDIGQGYVQPCMSTSYVNEGMHDYQINPEPVPDIRDIPQNNHVGAEMYIEGDSHGSRFPVTQGGHSIENLTTWEFDCLDVEFLNSAMEILGSGKSKAVWCKIRAVIKWGISVRKVAAARRIY